MKQNLSNKLTSTIIRIIKERRPKTVSELVILVKEQLQVPEKEIVESILKLQCEGKIDLKKGPQTAPPNLATYLKTTQAYWYWITIGITIATAIIVFTVSENFSPWVYIRYILGTIYVLWLPGYTFIRALFPAKPSTQKMEKDLDFIERVALSLGMSLALVPIIGLLLNYTPWGIRLTPIVLSLLALTVVFATVAVIREQQANMKIHSNKSQSEKDHGRRTNKSC